jgi:formate--tetrahydrofolate ligase
LKETNVDALKAGLVNLERHVENVRQFGVPPVIAINHFDGDADEEIAAIQEFADRLGVQAIVCRHWAEGGAGAEALAQAVVKIVDAADAKFMPLYPDEMPLAEKIRTIARKIYRAEDVNIDGAAMKQLKRFEELGFGAAPVCMAKTPYSFTADPSVLGAPSGHVLPIREVRLSAGAGFVVALCGDVMTMPGLPRRPAAEAITVNAGGEIEGLF